MEDIKLFEEYYEPTDKTFKKWFEKHNPSKILSVKCGQLVGLGNSLKLEKLCCGFNKLESLEFTQDFSIDAFELGIDITDLNRLKNLNYLNCLNNQFSEKYKKYIYNFCRKKNIDIYIQS